MGELSRRRFGRPNLTAFVSAAALSLACLPALAQAPLPEAKPRAQDQQPQTRSEGESAPETNTGASNSDPLAEIGTAIPETTLGRARMRDDLYALLSTAEDEESANKIAERIGRLWRVSGSPTVTLLIDRANEQMKEKKLETATKLLDAAVEIAPDFAEAWNRRAFVNFESGNVRNALGDLRRVLALDPNHFQALSGLGAIMKEIGNDAAALEAYERLLVVHPFAEGAEKAYEELKLSVEGQRL